MQSNRKIENEDSIYLLKTGIKYLEITLLLLIIAPILMTFGFRF